MHSLIPNNIKTLATEINFTLPGPVGDLEVLLSRAPSHSPRKAIAIICHPHPLYGGSLHNKVVTTLSKTFLQLGVQTIRFNFRGVGKSAGIYAHGKGELEDLMTLIQWVKKISPQDEIWLAGFSFGAYIAIHAAIQINCARLVSVAPPINHFPLSSPLISCPWIVIHGEQDDVVPAAAVSAWIETLNPKPTFILFPDTDHFFHGKLGMLKESLLRVVF